MAERSARTRAILAVPCPFCGAKPQRLCTVVTGSQGGRGKVTNTHHQARADVAAEARMTAATSEGDQ